MTVDIIYSLKDKNINVPEHLLAQYILYIDSGINNLRSRILDEWNSL